MADPESLTVGHLFKLGGSLLDLPDLVDRCRQLTRTSPGPNLFVVGGGAEVDRIRRQHSLGTLDDESAHWAAIDVMGSNARRLAEQWVGISVIEHLQAWNPVNEPTAIFDPLPMLRADAGRSLPIGWHVTSDSIAGWLAVRLRAPMLTLLKSTDWPPGYDIARATQNERIDVHFPTLAEELARRGTDVGWLNLRSAMTLDQRLSIGSSR